MSKQSDALRAYFEKNGIAQKEVCEALGLASGTLSNLLAGRYQISKKVARRFSDVYGFSLPFLITGEGDLVVPGPVNISRVDHVRNTGTINQASSSQDERIAQLEQQLDAEREEKKRLLGIIEVLTQPK